MSAESTSIAGNGPPVANRSPFDPNPPKLCPDETGATREGWEWCASCGGIQPPEHDCRADRVIAGMKVSEMPAMIRTQHARLAAWNAKEWERIASREQANQPVPDLGTDMANALTQLAIADEEIDQLHHRNVQACAGWRAADVRAEFAESLLCAIAFDHGVELLLEGTRDGFAWADCPQWWNFGGGRCAVCVEARR